MNAQTSACGRLWSERRLDRQPKTTVGFLFHASSYLVRCLWSFISIRFRFPIKESYHVILAWADRSIWTCVVPTGRSQLPTSFGRQRQGWHQQSSDSKQSNKRHRGEEEEEDEQRIRLSEEEVKDRVAAARRQAEEQQEEEDRQYARQAAAAAAAAVKGKGGHAGQEEEEGGEGEGEVEPPSLEGMNEKQKRLFQLKMKMVRC